jgi:hypothetical protein
MNRCWFMTLFSLGMMAFLHPAPGAHAQYYGGGFNGGGFGGGGFGGGGFGGGGFNGGGMGSFAPPHSIGGYYPVPYSTIFPGYVGNGYNAGPWGAGPVNWGGGVNGGNVGVPFNGSWNSPPMMIQGDGRGAAGMGGYSTGSPNMGGAGYLVPGNAGVAASSTGSPSPQVIHTGEEIKLVCPKAATGTLAYSLNGNPFTIQPGYSQNFRDDRTWKLEFRRGAEGSDLVTYTLRPGLYHFALGAEGWELRQVVKVQPGDLPPAPQPTPIPAPVPIPATTTRRQPTT